MRKFHPFFLIGTAGIIITALLHMVLALGFSLHTVHSIFFILYSNFIVFMTLGVGLTIKKQKEIAK